MVLDFRPGTDHPIVASLLPGRSARNCGRIAVGDTLLRVDNVSTEHKGLDEVRSMIAGPVGSTVSLAFENRSGVYEVDRLVRGEINGLGRSSFELIRAQGLVNKPLLPF